jgi:hypothetical protein
MQLMSSAAILVVNTRHTWHVWARLGGFQASIVMMVCILMVDGYLCLLFTGSCGWMGLTWYDYTSRAIHNS